MVISLYSQKNDLYEELLGLEEKLRECDDDDERAALDMSIALTRHQMREVEIDIEASRNAIIALNKAGTLAHHAIVNARDPHGVIWNMNTNLYELLVALRGNKLEQIRVLRRRLWTSLSESKEIVEFLRLY